jgi:hypothetical protein
LPSHYFLHSIPTGPIVSILLLLPLLPYLAFVSRHETLIIQPFHLFSLTDVVALPRI